MAFVLLCCVVRDAHKRGIDTKPMKGKKTDIKMISGFASATRVPSRSFSFQSVQKPGLYSALKFTHNTIDVCSKQGKHKTVRRRGDGDIQKLAAYGWHFHRLLSLSIVGCALCVYVYMRISPFSMISRGSSVVVFSAEGGSEKFAGSQLCTV